MIHIEPDGWYLAQLKPGGLKRAEENLKRQAFQSFMPKKRGTARRAGKLLNVTRPLFPGYLFVRIDAEKTGWRAINATYGVSKLIMLDSRGPTPVPTGLVAALAQGCDDENMWSGPSNLAVGDTVRVVAGPFADQLARIDALPDAGRAALLLEMMGRRVRADVRTDDLERA